MTDVAVPGALPSDWGHLQGIGLTPDLLPVVSNLSAVISPKSKLKALGKTPSMYNRDGNAVGIPEWTQHVATDRDIERWARNPDLGICIKTGAAWHLFAIDIDIDDSAASRLIVDYIFLATGELPMRWRSNSGKCLLVFRMRGEFTKRVINTATGAIEFLATGQQFIAVGTHTSGVRYQWDDGARVMPARVPELAPDEFFALWAGMLAQFGTEPERIARNGLARPAIAREASSVNDDTVEFLLGNGWVKSWTHDGRLNITCPWESEHTTGEPGDPDDSSTQYFPAGVGGFDRGHFMCLHAHCAGRKDHDFTDAIGLVAAEFTDLTQEGEQAADGEVLTTLDGKVVDPTARALPAFRNRTRTGEIPASMINLLLALRRSDVCGMRIAWDTFRDEIVWATDGQEDWRAFRDHDYVRLREHLELNSFKPVGRELIRDAVHAVAVEHTMDTAVMWCENNATTWDGVDRVSRFYHTYFRAVDNHYTRAVARYTWSALAGRALSPGVQADMAIVLKSEQGTVKTQGIKAMAPHTDAFGEVDLGKGDDVLARQTRGKLVVEISELRGLNSREHGAIKSWVSRTHEEWVPKFKEFSTKFPRRFICFGTTNEDEFLADATGERRWLPMEVGRTDLEALRRDVDQLWAQGAALFKEHGVMWRDAEELARREHGRFKVQDSWHDIIVAWLNEQAFGEPEGVLQGDLPVRTHEVLQSALRFNPQNITRKDEMRVTHVLRAEKHYVTTCRRNGEVFRGWVNDERLERARLARQALDDIG